MKDIEEITKNQKSEIVADFIENEAEDFRLAFDCAAKYLSIAPRSEKEIKDRLYKKGFHKQTVESAVEKLKGYRYIDDEAYVCTYLDYYGEKYGLKKIEFKLTTEKGVDKNLVARIFAEREDKDNEREKCLKFAAKYAASKHLDTTQKSRAKLGAYLFSKGFEWGVITPIVESVLNSDEALD